MSDAAGCVDRTTGEPRRVQVGDIARAYGAALRDSYALTLEQHAVLTDLERCRTAALGGHMHACDRCGYAVPLGHALTWAKDLGAMNSSRRGDRQ